MLFDIDNKKFTEKIMPSINPYFMEVLNMFGCIKNMVLIKVQKYKNYG